MDSVLQLKDLIKHTCLEGLTKVCSSVVIDSDFKLMILLTFSVTLSGFKSQTYQSAFKEFLLIAVPSGWSDGQSYRLIGQFELLPATSNADESTQEAVISQRNCPGAVTDANPEKMKYSISVNWIAPRHSQGCISFKFVSFLRSNTFKKNSAIVEQSLSVLIRSGSKTIMLLRIPCVKIVSNRRSAQLLALIRNLHVFLEMHMKKMMQPCCACGEAKYQLTFKGLWSSQTHQKDWPGKTGV